MLGCAIANYSRRNSESNHPHFPRCKISKQSLIDNLSALKGTPMATLELPVRPRTSSSSQSHQGPFANEPFYDFRHEENARKMRAAIERVRGQLGREYDLVIGGEHIKTTDKIMSLNPSKPSQVVGIHQKAGKEHVEPAMTAALKAFQTWSRTPIEERASLLFRAADRMREHKMDYMAWLVFEVSKNWGEADADISE